MRQTNKQNRTKDMEIKNQTDRDQTGMGAGQWRKEGKGSSQGTCINDPRTKTMGEIECGR